ncbi:bifunctional diguanylate cyclase/phosphodiesterase [Geitlerinema sp. PCC 7407]|uniref:putative bifunctional diguanylate cyclase/phosphodiesterase n=1 Tax=Geitlerinema sp. PCC 7407 TaxID=1173025 RepID=UPI00029F8485|nr:GGDEF domain-containing response regulator [Geitlerinema sp. PCC 7407]AFY64591.1 response regulator receiver modulated diguanylate cyclase/phosphodiesterase [Geitlerinema sp. PCC 7407]
MEKHISILIVDDVPDNLRLLSSMLESRGYSTRKAISSSMALLSIEASPPDLVLLDIQLPGMSGYEVCRYLKQDPRFAEIPVIFLSALNDIGDKVEGFEAGGADFITKPFHIEEVLRRVQHQLSLRRAQLEIHQLNSQLEARVRERTQQLELANSRLLEMAFQDSLTRLPNRALLMEQLQACLDYAQRSPDHQFAILYLDCDRFKVINDSLGHPAGDELLVAITQRIKALLRQDDFLARLGGDEFVILLRDSSDRSAAILVAERILDAFTASFPLRERDVFISFSIGITFGHACYQQPEDLLRDADTAMYHAKSSGKSQYQIFTPAMHETALKRLQIETDLRKAVKNQEFEIYYQPIINLQNGTIAGAEALLRWIHPTHGMISPAQFIPIAEETGLILQLGNWVLWQSCHQLNFWQTQQLVSSDFFVSINLAAAQFAEPNFVQQIDAVIAETQIAPECLKLEITESTILENTEASERVFQNLRDRQIEISIDDFGTGYSSLCYLSLFPINTLKIDQSFLRTVEDNARKRRLLTAIVNIGDTMDMTLVAEGIETPQQLSLVRSLGCQLGQGYLFSAPINVQNMNHFLTNQTRVIKSHLESSV